MHDAGSCSSTYGRRQPDLVDLARRAINYLTRIAPKEEGYIPFFGGKAPWHGIAYLTHAPWDYGDGVGRILEALTMVRRVTGSKEAMDVQEAMVKKLVGFYEPDGVTYRQVSPWSTRVTGPFELRSSAMALAALIEDGYEYLRPQLDAAVNGLDRLYSIEQLPIAKGSWNGESWDGGEVGVGLPVIDALVRAYLVSGNEKGLEVAGRMIRHYFTGEHALFDQDGRFIFREKAQTPTKSGKERLDYEASVGHVHTRTAACTGLARYAVVTGDKDLIALARRVHDHCMGYGTTFGWFPENLFTDGHEVSELCCTLDMIETQCLLAGAGQIELYGLAERFVSNHATVCQFIPDEEVRAALIPAPGDLRDVIGRECYSEVLERLAGGYVCVTYPDDYYTAYPGSRNDEDATYLIDISGCCSGSGAKAAYVAWREAVSSSRDDVCVNFLLDRSHFEVDIRFDGNTGILDIRPRAPKAFRVRVPDWTDAARITVRTAGREIAYRLQDGYLHMDRVKSDGDSIEVHFPIQDETAEVGVAKLPYRATWRGSRVVGMHCIGGVQPRRNPYLNGFVGHDERYL